MNEYFESSKLSPPVDTWIWACYESVINDKSQWQLLKTCKRGCCVQSSIGSMIIPVFWYQAAEKDALTEQKNWENISSMNISDLYD